MTVVCHADPHFSGSQQRSRPASVEISTQARSHPLFPVLDYIAKGVQIQSQRYSVLDRKLSKLEEETQHIKTVQEELRSLMQQVNKKNFSLKDEGFEVIRITHVHSQCNVWSHNTNSFMYRDHCDRVLELSFVSHLQGKSLLIALL